MESIADLSPIQKVAALLVAMGNERAGKIIGKFNAKEVRALMSASETLGDISEEILEQLVDEFESACESQKTMIKSSGALQSIIEQSLTDEQKEALSQGPDAAKIALRTKSIWEMIDGVNEEDFMEFLISENENSAAFILSKIAPKRSAEIISKLEGDPQKLIVAAMISSRPPLQDAVEMIEKVVTDRFSRAISAKTDKGGHKRVAGMLNELDQEMSENLFTQLEAVVPEEQLRSVKSMMFRFEDLTCLDKTDLAKVFDAVPTELTTLALRGANDLLKTAVLESLGQRTARMMEADLQTPSNATEEEIKTAQKQIASQVLMLSSDGTITIPEADIAA